VGNRCAGTGNRGHLILKKAFAPQRHKEHEGKSASGLAEAFHQFGLSLYLHKHSNFFVPFVSLWLMIAVFRLIPLS
jgi:hypothetical protein